MITATGSSLPREHESARPGPVGLRFRSILAATDCSPVSATAVKLAARLAKESHARLYVLHAVMPDLHAVNVGLAVPTLDWMNLETARERLHTYAEHIPELRTVKHKEIVFEGSPSDAIESAAESNGVDLLVLGSRGRRGLAKLTLGSVAEWAIRRLHYPVLVAGPMCDKSVRPFKSILLATDLSEQALRAAHYAGSMAQDYNARLTVLHVLSAACTPQEHAHAEVDTMERLHQLLPSDCGEWCTLKFEVPTGDIAAAILHAARECNANMIVMGARHRSPLADHVPRTKLSAILRAARSPVLVVPGRFS